jgi:hypothetical protein
MHFKMDLKEKGYNLGTTKSPVTPVYPEWYRV